jgi:hypothetical protein
VTRRKPWTVKRLECAINAVNAMLAGEVGEGDWDPDHEAEDMEAAREILIDIRERLTRRNRS